MAAKTYKVPVNGKTVDITASAKLTAGDWSAIKDACNFDIVEQSMRGGDGVVLTLPVITAIAKRVLTKADVAVSDEDIAALPLQYLTRIATIATQGNSVNVPF